VTEAVATLTGFVVSTSEPRFPPDFCLCSIFSNVFSIASIFLCSRDCNTFSQQTLLITVSYFTTVLSLCFDDYLPNCRASRPLADEKHTQQLLVQMLITSCRIHCPTGMWPDSLGHLRLTSQTCTQALNHLSNSSWMPSWHYQWPM